MPDNLSDDEEGRWLFCQAAVWPDHVRTKRKVKLPPNPKVKASYHRGAWHFIDNPFVLVPSNTDEADRKRIEDAAKAKGNVSHSVPDNERIEMNAIQAIGFNSNVMKQGSDEDKAVAVCWLIHLIGDIHQPLHAVSLFSLEMFNPDDEKDGDRGGNEISFGRGKNDNLHFLWDDEVEKDNGFGHVLDRTQELLDDTDLLTVGERAQAKADPVAWADESYELAKDEVYTKTIRRQLLRAERRGANPHEDEIVELPANYRTNARKVSERRVVEGGFRLARHLKKLVQ